MSSASDCLHYAVPQRWKKNWIREEGVGAEERGTEGKNDTACYHRHTVEFAVGKVAQGIKK